ncbi:MAG: HDOD domain-containing protein [Pseudomonadota bacterium]
MPADLPHKPVHGVFARALRDIRSGRKRLPSMPDVAMRLRAAMQEDDVSIQRVARVIQADASTAGYLIAVANSPIYRGVQPASSVEQGVTRLGLATTRNLVTAHAMRSMFQTSSRSLAVALRQTWVRSARTAAFGALLASHCRDTRPDQAILAGLVMDIGCLPLLRALDESPLNTDDQACVTASLDAYAPRTGAEILERWRFDGELVAVARHRHQFDRVHDGDGDLADLSLVARRLALASEPCNLALPPVAKLPAFQRLELGSLSVEDTIEMLMAAESELREVMRLLGVSV